MTIENTLSAQNTSVYYSVGTSSTELILQPGCSRSQAMRAAWESVAVFQILLLPLTILPTILVIIFILMMLSFTAPQFQNPWITKIIITSLSVVCLVAITFFTGKAVWMSGYTTFIFDRIQKLFLINTVNLLGQKSIRKISFAQIQDAQLQEYESDSVSVMVCLILEKHKILGFTRQEKIVLSSFSSEEYESVANLTALKHHEELLILVRKALLN